MLFRSDESFYLLTLAAMAKELKIRGKNSADVFLSVGLPLTRFGAEKDNFIKYLSKKRELEFKFENRTYRVNIIKVSVFPQCYAAVADKMPQYDRKHIVVDIGSWTMDLMTIKNMKPELSECDTRPMGLITCMHAINKECVAKFNCEYESKVMLTKSECWSYEKEWRSRKIAEYGLWKSKIYPIIDAHSCITAIYLGCNMPDEYQKVIIDHYRNTEVKVFQMKLCDDKFDMYFEQC